MACRIVATLVVNCIFLMIRCYKSIAASRSGGDTRACKTPVTLTRFTLSSRPKWRDLKTPAETQTLGSLFMRSFGCAQDDRLGCHPDSLYPVIPTRYTLSSRPAIPCHPDRSGGI